MKRILAALVLCILLTTTVCADQTETATPKYRCEKGHITEGFCMTITYQENGKEQNTAFITCPVCLRNWASNHLPKVTELK